MIIGDKLEEGLNRKRQYETHYYYHTAEAGEVLCVIKSYLTTRKCYVTLEVVVKKQQQKFQRKTIIAIFVLLIGVLVFSVVWFKVGKERNSQPALLTPFLTPSPQPTDTPFPTETPIPTGQPIDMNLAHWKTYQNTNLGFAFQHPDNWELSSYSWGGALDSKNTLVGHSIGGLMTIPAGDALNVPTIVFVYWDNPNNLPLADLNQQYQGEMGIDLNNPKPQTISINGISGLYQQTASCDPYYCNKYIFSVKNKIFVFMYLYGTPIDNINNAFNQVLSTLKFANF